MNWVVCVNNYTRFEDEHASVEHVYGPFKYEFQASDWAKPRFSHLGYRVKPIEECPPDEPKAPNPYEAWVEIIDALGFKP